jgi:hypothetical protein
MYFRCHKNFLNKNFQQKIGASALPVPEVAQKWTELGDADLGVLSDEKIVATIK